MGNISPSNHFSIRLRIYVSCLPHSIEGQNYAFQYTVELPQKTCLKHSRIFLIMIIWKVIHHFGTLTNALQYWFTGQYSLCNVHLYKQIKMATLKSQRTVRKRMAVVGLATHFFTRTSSNELSFLLSLRALIKIHEQTSLFTNSSLKEP